MRIVYLFTHDIVKHAGVTKKVLSQTEAWKNFGHEVKIFNIILKKEYLNTKGILEADRYYRINIFKEPENLLNDMESFSPDIVYMRFELYKPFLGKILKKNNTVIELNTDDFSELKHNFQKNFFQLYRFIYYNITKQLLYKKAAGFIAVSSEIKNLDYLQKFKNKVEVIPNSINLIKYNVQKEKKNNNVINILFMGNLEHEWNGIDKVFELAKKTVGKLNFHIIGLNKKYKTDFENIKFYGYLQKEEYLEIVRKCDIGLGTVALHRKKMYEASPLKVREYLAYGLPIIIGYSDTAFVKSILPEWVLELPNENNNVSNNIDLILKFCKKMKNRIIHHEEINGYIDSNILERKKLIFFKKILRDVL